MIEEAIERLKAGEVIAYPTETLYGLGADPRNPASVKKLLDLKTRHSGEGISLIADENFVPPGDKAQELASKYWPGPLTMVLDLEDSFPKGIAAKDGSVAVRVSSSSLARELAAGIGGFITATSANPHGEPAAQTAEEARNYFPGLYILEIQSHISDSVATTIIDARSSDLQVLRQGSISI